MEFWSNEKILKALSDNTEKKNAAGALIAVEGIVEQTYFFDPVLIFVSST